MNENIRDPDNIIRSSQLVSSHLVNDEDLELMEIIRKSREEYNERLMKEEEENKLHEQLVQTLSLPLSRLRLWLNYSIDDKEKKKY